MANKCLENDELQNATEFLVPFTNILVNLLSEKNITIWEFKKKLNNIKITDLSEKDGQVESLSIINNFRVYVLYGGTRNFMLKLLDIWRGVRVVYCATLER